MVTVIVIAIVKVVILVVVHQIQVVVVVDEVKLKQNQVDKQCVHQDHCIMLVEMIRITI